MTKTVIALTLILLTSLQGISQCDKKMKWNAIKADMFDAKGALLESKAATIIVETGPQEISVMFKESTEDGLEGSVKEKNCDWKDAFKNGKTVYRTTANIDGKTSNAIFTLEAKEGKITILVDIEMM